ncbi:ASCH domain-containing protein [Bradyrhizobium sp.]
MKAISLWQPWASLIACGAKPFETRHWAPPRELIGQTIAIHAAKKVDKDAAAMATDIMYGQFDNHGGLAERMEASWGIYGDADNLMVKFGDTIMPVGFSSAPQDVKPLIPPPRATGRQKFFDLPQGWMVEGMQA